MPAPKALALAIGVVALAACGSSSPSGVSPSSWVETVCGAVGPFEQDVVSRSSALDVATFKNAAQSKIALEHFLEAVQADATSAVRKLRSAGAPDVANGKAIDAAVVGAFTRVQDTMRSAVAQAHTLPTSSPAALRSSARALGIEVRSSLSSFPSLSSSALRSPQIDQAAAKEPACRNIAGG
jgi:hypothetical protein